MKNITKFYYSTMKGAPVISSNWGSLLKALRIVLIDGFNKNPVVSNTVEGGLRKFTFVEDPGYLLHQVVTLSGCTTNPEINGEYRVQKMEGFSVYLATEDVVSTLGGDMFLLTSPMGWSEVFTGTDKAVFRAKDTLKNPFFLRIDNSLPVGYDPSWSKFARITMAEYMLDIDNFGTFAKAPVYQNLPRDTNELGDKVTGVKGIFGIAKWYHGIGYSGYYSLEATTNFQSPSLEYEIVGDNSGFYFMPRITSRVDSRSLYSFTTFVPNDTRDTLNCFLSASHCHLKADDVITNYRTSGSNTINNGWELRFNTTTGEVSNNSSRGFSPNSWDSFWTPDKAFDGVISTGAGGFHPSPSNDVQYFIGYEFETPQHVNSISVLMRPDHNNSRWIYASIESSEDGINWISQGYANLNISTNTRFYTAKIEGLNVVEKLTTCSTDLVVKNLNIYNPRSDGVFKGQVLELNEPVIREVALYERGTRQLIAIVWSDSEGFYEFKNLNQNKSYYVHAIDNNKIYNAVTKDMIDLHINSEYK